jgi:hypothetical protein
MADTTADSTAETAVDEGTPASTAAEALSMLTKDSTATEESKTDEQDTATTETESKKSESESEDESPATDGDEPDDHADDDELGDAGKKAIDRMKTERNSALRAQKKAEKQLAESQDEVFRLRVEKLAAGRLTHPELALKLLPDLKGQDEKAIKKGIDGLLSTYPDLAPESTAETVESKAGDDLSELFPNQSETLKPADQNRVNAEQFGSILSELGISL